jgi:type II secretory pathway pseudopilin PulG
MTWSKKGFSLVEVVISLFIFIVVTTVAVNIFSPAIETVTNTERYVKLSLLALEEAEILKGVGFWVKDIDTAAPDFPGNQYDHAIIWSSRMAEAGFTGRGVIDVTFLKEENNDLVPFAGPEFDGDLDRNVVSISISLYGANGEAITQNVSLRAYPSDKNLKAILAIIRNALELSFEEVGNYPASLATLVPTYLVEIPNDPYTKIKKKTNHTEEITDWYYNDNGNTITLAPNTRRGQNEYTETWTY